MKQERPKVTLPGGQADPVDRGEEPLTRHDLIDIIRKSLDKYEKSPNNQTEIHLRRIYGAAKDLIEIETSKRYPQRKAMTHMVIRKRGGRRVVSFVA